MRGTLQASWASGAICELFALPGCTMTANLKRAITCDRRSWKPQPPYCLSWQSSHRMYILFITRIIIPGDVKLRVQSANSKPATLIFFQPHPP